METPVSDWRRVYTLRDFSGALFRQAHVAIGCFLVLVAGVVALILMIPDRYQSELRILVKHDRADSLITSSQGSERATPPDVTEQELNSEVELLQGPDLLEQVARDTRLAERSPQASWHPVLVRAARATGLADRWPLVTPPVAPEETLSRAVTRLRDGLQVAPIRRTWMISVTYASPDPRLSTEVLETLTRLYLEKHLAVRRPPGTRQFFVDQAAQAAEELRAVQAQVRVFSEEHGTVSAADEKDAVLGKLTEFESLKRQTEAALAEAAGRLTALEVERARTPARHTASITTGDATGFTQEMQSKLAALQLRRTELLQKFTPEYRLVADLDQQIDQTRSALAEARRSQLKQETTAENPTMRWLENEIARVRTEHAALWARTKALTATSARYRAEAQSLDAEDIQQAELLRQVKAAEDKYVLYQRKQEEARISDALDRTRIANVAVVQAPEVPFEPLPRHPVMWMAIGLLVAMVLSVGIAVMKDVVSSSVRIRTPDELQTTLDDVPVLAWVPAEARRWR
jgi:uncharacterized protein involved in exopolysaccharide biosynthesis